MVVRSGKGEAGMVAILGLAVGLMSFEQLSVSYLMPFIKPYLQLTNAQVGLLLSAYWVAFAVSSYVTGTLAESLGKRKSFLVIATMAIAVCSVLSGLAFSFGLLLVARSLMGVLEGPVVPLAQSILALESSVERRGINMGIVGGLCANLLGIFIAPLVLVQIAVIYGWRTGFFVGVLPGLICAALVARFIREPAADFVRQSSAGAKAQGRKALIDVLRFRNVWLCAALCCCFVAYLSIGFAFLPLFYVNVRQFSSPQMSFLMGLLGMSSILYAVILPMASDRLGRKPVMVAASLLSLLCPLAALYYRGPMIMFALLLFIGWALSGTASLSTGTIPSETVPARSISTAIGLIVSLGVIVGGLVGPSVAGWSADYWGPQAPVFLQAGCAGAAALAAFGLRETAPRRISKAAAPLAPAVPQ